jgi:hypothetical protein
MHLRAFVATADAKSVRHAERTVPWPITEVDAHAVGLGLGALLGPAVPCTDLLP